LSRFTKKNGSPGRPASGDDHIEKIIEVKNSDHSIGQALRYFHEKYQLPAVQVVKELKREKIEQGIEVLQGVNFLKSLDL
jgi:hypothetical protein